MTLDALMQKVVARFPAVLQLFPDGLLSLYFIDEQQFEVKWHFAIRDPDLEAEARRLPLVTRVLPKAHALLVVGPVI